MGGKDRYGYRTTGWMGKTRRDSDLNSTGTHKYRGLTSTGLFSLGFSHPRVSRNLSVFYCSATVNDLRNSKVRKGKKGRKNYIRQRRNSLLTHLFRFLSTPYKRKITRASVSRGSTTRPTIQIAKWTTVSRPSRAIRLGTRDSKLS